MFSLAPLGVWLRLVGENGGVPPRYWGRLATALAISTLATPLRVAECLRYGPSRMARVQIDKEPLYIQGFGRSGTTHLHNLLAQDPALGFVSTLQALAAPVFLTARGRLGRLVSIGMPATRPMDNMPLSLELPQEEDLALANTSPLSFMHHISFPGRTMQYLEKYATMRLTPAEMARWERAYLDVLRKATLASGGRRLVLKSPANLGRTRVLLRLFPGAKFIHIVRNPYVVYRSMTHMYRHLLPAYQLDDVDPDEMDAAIRYFYVASMGQYMKDRESIPRGQLAEVRFEDLERDPMAELERLYAELALPGWEQARKPIGDYVQSASGYRKNVHEIDAESIRVVDREWGFGVDAWGYRAPSGSTGGIDREGP